MVVKMKGIKVGDYVCTNEEYCKSMKKHVSGKITEIEETNDGVLLNLICNGKRYRINISWFI